LFLFGIAVTGQTWQCDQAVVRVPSTARCIAPLQCLLICGCSGARIEVADGGG